MNYLIYFFGPGDILMQMFMFKRKYLRLRGKKKKLSMLKIKIFLVINCYISVN